MKAPGGRDRRARLVTTTAGTARLRSDQPLRVTVVGGGLAGMAAAVSLAERGAKVTVREAGPVLGGRLSSWPDQLTAAAGGGPIEMERGFHAFFRQYYNARALLRRVDPKLSFLRPCHDYPLYGPNGAFQSFANLPATPPLNLAALVKRTPTLDLAGLRRINGDAAAEMLAFDGDDTYARFDSISAKDYLDQVNFPAEARRMLFEVFAHSFFNPEEVMSAGEMLMMFHLYFCGSSEGILFDVLDAPFNDAVWAPLRRYLERLGGEVHCNARVGELPEPGPDEAFVLAANVEALQTIVGRNPWMTSGSGGDVWSTKVHRRRQAAPFAVLRLWLDRDVNIDRAPFAGTAAMGILDNISCVHRYQDEARTWSRRSGGSVIELHAYALPSEYDHDETRVRQELLDQLHAVYPETRGAAILDERLLLRQDCPSFEVGSYVDRLAVATPHPRVKLAGDHVLLGFPTALMERAVTTGFVAANELLSPMGVSPEPIWSVPPRGVLAGLQAWQRRRRAAPAV
jgi:carotenoid phi-ring synthase / carotenoid chi-ring synthase